MLDLDKPLNARFYAFGNGDKKADVIDAHIVARDQTKAECKGDTFMDLSSKLCTQHCHEDCDPLYGKYYNESLSHFRILCTRYVLSTCHALQCDKHTIGFACWAVLSKSQEIRVHAVISLTYTASR